jgi:hypothetical protein
MNATENGLALSYDAVDVARFLGFKNAEAARRMFGAPPAAIPGFITFFDCGLTINILRLQFGEMFYNQTWYDTEAFAKLVEAPRYRQLRMTAVPDSFDTTFVEQQELLPIDEEVPSPRVVVMGMVIHFLATGERLHPDYWVRCIETDSDGYRVDIGYFDADGLRVGRDRDDHRGEELGLSSARKF